MNWLTPYIEWCLTQVKSDFGEDEIYERTISKVVVLVSPAGVKSEN